MKIAFLGRALPLLAIAGALALSGCQRQGSNASSNGPAPAPAADRGAAANAGAPAPAPNAAAPAPAPAAATAWSPAGYELIGTEPFWGGTVSSTRIVYTTPDNMAGDRVAVTAAYSATREVYTGALRGKPFVLTLTKGPCSDGMSDNVHDFTASLQVDAETRPGCANRPK